MNDVLHDHFRNPRNRGEPALADGSGEAGDEGCGAVIAIHLLFDGPMIRESRFTASGSSAAIAAGSYLTEAVTGKDWRHAAAIPVARIEEALGLSQGDAASGPSGGSARNESILKAADFAVEALHRALEDSIRRGSFPAAAHTEPDTVLVAMSGGVDSSTACLLKQRSGRHVIGVTMRLWSCPEKPGAAGVSCCSPSSIRDARRTAHQLGLPHLTVDCADDFRAHVVESFAEEYLLGRTPNPCTLCNGAFRFPLLISLADRLGAGMVATGHYARVVGTKTGMAPARGADPAKDQSYVLWGIAPELLERLAFPLGEMKKPQTRQLARAAGMITSDRPESQDICFIPDGDYRRFLRSYLAEKKLPAPGEGVIADVSGKQLGTHRGYLDFTVGQRHGLGGGSPEPLYVIRTVPEENLVVAGPRRHLEVSRIEITDLNCFAPIRRDDVLGVQLRYHSRVFPCRIEAGGGSLWLKLHEPALGIAPGQSAVLYRDDIVIAGGVIVGTGR